MRDSGRVVLIYIEKKILIILLNVDKFHLIISQNINLVESRF